MYLYFDKEGVLKTKIDHGEKLRQGGDLHITVCLDYDFWGERVLGIGTNPNKSVELDEEGNVVAKGDIIYLKLTDDNDFSSMPIFAVSTGHLETFERLYGSEVVYNLIPGKPYLMYQFDLSADIAAGFFGKVRLNFQAQNVLTVNDYVRIAPESKWSSQAILKNGEVGISYNDKTSTYKMRVGNQSGQAWKDLTPSTINSGVTDPTESTLKDTYYINTITYEVWHWQSLAIEENENGGYWDKLIEFTPNAILRTGKVAIGSADVLIEKTVGYERRKIDEQISIRYNDIMGELKKAFAKIAVASTKPDWKEEDATSPAYIRNKPTIADQGEVDKNFEEVNKKLTELEARPIGTQIMDGTELVKTIKKSDIIFADDEIIINGGEA